jgi:hypothetical protein
MTLRIRIRTARPSGAAEDSVMPFSSITKRRVPGAWMVIGSMAAHVLVIALVAVVSNRMSAWLGDDDVDWPPRAEPLRLHLSEPLFFRAHTPDSLPSPPSQARSAGKLARKGIDEPGEAGSLVPRRLELPVPSRIAKNVPVILQPDSYPQIVPPPKDLPPLAFWARQGPDFPKPPPSTEVVVPGRTDEQSPAPRRPTRSCGAQLGTGGLGHQCVPTPNASAEPSIGSPPNSTS